MTDAPNWSDVLALVTELDRSGYEEAEVVTDAVTVRLSRTPGGLNAAAPPLPPRASDALGAAAALRPATPSVPVSANPKDSETLVGETPGGDDLLEVTAPMLGVAYLRPAPGQPPFVVVGDTVDAESSVAVIEVMKMMNTVSAGVSGRVVEILVADGALVEYGTVLFRLERA